MALLVPPRRLLLPLLLVAACGGGDPSTVAVPSRQPGTGPTGLATAVASGVPTDSVDRAISITVAGGQVTGGVQEVRLARASRVRITVTADVADVLHVHGYDLREQLAVDQPGSVEFVADRSGPALVELEQSGLPLARLQVG